MTDRNIIPSTDSDKVVIVGQNEQQNKQVTHQMKIPKGHIVFEINLETGEAKPAEYEEVNFHINDMCQQVNMHLQVATVGKAIPATEVKKKLIRKDESKYTYISALNIENAGKIFATKAALKWWNELDDVEKDHLSQIFFKTTRQKIFNKQIIKLWSMEMDAQSKTE